jgi:hypothetical protein
VRDEQKKIDGDFMEITEGKKSVRQGIDPVERNPGKIEDAFCISLC